MISYEHLRLKYRIKWEEYEDYIICDIEQRSYERVAEFVMDHLFRDKVYGALGVWMEPNAWETIKTYVNHVLGNDSSIMVISKDELEIKAVALMLLTKQEFRSWTNLETMAGWSGKLWFLVSISKLMHDDYQKSHDMDEFDAMVIHEFVFEEEIIRDRFLIIKLFRALRESARHMGATRVTFIVWEKKYQRIIRALGWRALSRLIYSIHVTNQERPLDVLRTLGEMAAVLFETKLDPITPFREMPGFEQIHREIEEREKFLAKNPA